MPDFDINVRVDALRVQQNLTSMAQKQVPFAVATALTMLAKEIQIAERTSLHSTFDRPTPFTVNSISIIPAKKDLWQATVFVKDIAAQYLYPYEVGGEHKLIGPLEKTWLNPKDFAMLNQYGNFPVATLQRLLGSSPTEAAIRHGKGLKPFPGKPGVFIGSVMTKNGGRIGGVWQRVNKNVSRTGRGAKNGRGLKLLIRFGDARPVRQHLDFVKRAEKLVQGRFNMLFGRALAKAIATAR